MKLIAGIDPGTTVGWAVLDLNGNAVAAGSQKEFSIDALVAKFTKLGRVILVGSDKAKIPSFAQHVATKLGAKIVGPQQDLRVDEKRSMVGSLDFNNSHEMDALASSFAAYKKFQPLLNKIRSFLLREDSAHLFESVAELVIKEEISIRAALSILTPQAEIIEEKTEEQKRDGDIVRLYSALSRARKDIALLLSKNQELARKLMSAEQRVSALKERASVLVKPKTPAEIAKIKESQIASLTQRLKNSLKSQEEMKLASAALEREVIRQEFVALLRLKRLGWDEVLQNKDVIYEGAVIFVDDANQMSERAIDWLHGKGVQLIVCSKLPGERARASLPFACVQAYEYKQFNRIVLVRKSWLERVRADRLVLSKLVDEYKKERSTV